MKKERCDTRTSVLAFRSASRCPYSYLLHASDLTENQKPLECFRIGDLTRNKKATQRAGPRERRKVQ